MISITKVLNKIW